MRQSLRFWLTTPRGCLLLIVIVIGLFVFATAFEMTGEAVGVFPTPLPTGTPLPTETPLPTDTPTETPIPTDTPEPTETGIPTDTPVPVNTPIPVPTLVAAPVNAPTIALTATPLPTATPVPPTPAPTAVPTAATARLGQNVNVGKVRWRAISADDLGNKLHSDNEFTKDTTTGGKFIKVVFEIEDLANIPASYFSPDIYDAQGRKYSHFSDEFQYLPDNATCPLLVLNPNLPATCTEIYEVPSNSSGYKLEATDFNPIFGNTAMIELQ